MQLLSLAISGFKSFAKPTKLLFSPGVTSIVGPNGCGKSNVVDSMRWVLGEQRVAVLRSGRMDNVIFNGTANRKPLGIAEVKLVLDNTKGLLDISYSEVEIARRLYRDGTSEYLLNGNLCRLKDITDLLHDSGMGPNPYTILELGMVEDILREDGEGRRALFEEAAGVAKYKLRRRQAQQKLRSTEEDLLRLADIISEIERQVSSLKRQVARARRYEEHASQLKVLESALLYQEYVRLTSELEPLRESIKHLSTSSSAAKGIVRKEESKLAELQTVSLQAETDLSDKRKELQSVVSQISTLEAEDAVLRTRDQSARQAIDRTKRERILLTEKREMLSERNLESERHRETLIAELDVSEKKVAESAAKLESEQIILTAVEDEVRAHSEAINKRRSELSDREREYNSRIAARADLSGRKDVRQQELASIENERSAARERLSILAVQKEQVAGEESDLNSQVGKYQQELTLLDADLLAFEEKSRSLASLIEATKSKLELLVTLEEKGPRSSSALRVLKEKPVGGLVDLIGDLIEVDDVYRTAFQSVLGPVAYFYLTESLAATLSAVQRLRDENAGQAMFIHDEEFANDDSSQISLPQGAISFALNLVNGLPPHPVLRHFLGRVVMVKDWDAILQLRDWAKTNDCTLVTLDGQWITPNGLVRGGSQETPQPSDLGLRKQILRLEEALRDALSNQEATASRQREAKSRRSSLEQSLADLRKRMQQISLKATAVREQEVKIETTFGLLDQRESSVRSQIEALDRQISENAAEIDVAVSRLEQAKTELKSAESSGGGLSDKFAIARTKVAQAQDARHEQEKSRDTVQHKLDLVDADILRVRQTLEEISQNLLQVEENAEQAAAEITSLEGKIALIEETLQAKFKSRDQIAQTVDHSTTRLDQCRSHVREQEDLLRKMRENQELESEGERRIELEVAKLEGELNALLASALNQYAYDLVSPEFLVQHPSVRETQTNAEMIQDLKQKIDRLGPVNLMALQEYETENSRLDTFLKNRNDLLEAKKTLEETIGRINETAQARFLHTFEAVRANFQRLFTEFFGAGEADLILSGTDLLEADITLWANPSGKRLKSLSLMSGGEKTMTAIALLFSLYQVKPSPFCVFDEVDAPLDDINIDRFNRMIKLHSTDTQFILITHNKRTMETADNLYGVTMEEEGISKLVSVRLLSEVV